MARFIAVRYDGDSRAGDALCKRYGVRGYPTLVVVDGAGRKLDDFAGFRSSSQLIQRLRRHVR